MLSASLLLVVLVVASVFQPVPAYVGTPDQAQTTFDSSFPVDSAHPSGQTFTAGLDGSLTEVDLVIGCMIQSGGVTTCDGYPAVTVQIRSGNPGGALLSSASLPGLAFPNYWPAILPSGWVAFTFSSPAPVVAGGAYAIVITTSTTTQGYYYDTVFVGGNLYTYGARWTYATGTWYESTGADLAFKTYVLAPTSPTTATETITVTSVSTVTSYVSTVPPTELKYDDGTAETHPTLDTDIWLGDLVAVRFSLESSMLPADLVGVRFYAQQGGSAPVYIYRNLPATGCMSTDELASFYMNFNDNTWSEQALTGVTATGDFCVVVEYPIAPIASPPEIGLDNSSTDNGHSWVFYAGAGSWQHIGDTPIGNGNLMIRAVFRTLTGPTTVTSVSTRTSYVTSGTTFTTVVYQPTTRTETSHVTDTVTSVSTEHVTETSSVSNTETSSVSITETVTSYATNTVTSHVPTTTTETFYVTSTTSLPAATETSYVTNTVTTTAATTFTATTSISTKPTYTLIVRAVGGWWYTPGIAGATVTLDGVRVGTTDMYGRLVIQDVSAGSHQLVVSKAGYRSYTATIYLTSSKAVTAILQSP